MPPGWPCTPLRPAVMRVSGRPRARLRIFFPCAQVCQEEEEAEGFFSSVWGPSEREIERNVEMYQTLLSILNPR